MWSVKGRLKCTESHALSVACDKFSFRVSNLGARARRGRGNRPGFMHGDQKKWLLSYQQVRNSMYALCPYKVAEN